MAEEAQSDRLSWGDTVFLHLEREGMPLNVASVCEFEGDISIDDCVDFVESKLPFIPRYLKRVVSPALGIGLPSWEYDPEFELRRHVRELTLKRGTETELKGVAGRLFSTVMDRRRPLWDITVVRGLKGNRTGIIIRLHHCMADGIAGVGLVNLLLDQSPQAPPLRKQKIEFPVPPPQPVLSSLTASVVDAYSDFVKRVLSIFEDLLTMGERAAANAGAIAPADELSKLLPEITAFTQRLRFNVPYRGPQKFAWGNISLEEVKAVRRTCGASVNDVILALVTASVRRYLELHGDPIKGRLFRMMVPVNLRGTTASTELGNRISLVPVTVPLDIRDARKLLAAVHRRTEFLKDAHAAELVSLAGGLIGMFPTPLQAFAGPIVSRLPVTPFNLVCTNVPGPQYPLYLLGHKMLTWYPYVPVGGEMAVNCAVLSYNGTIFFGFSGDVHAAPDLKKLEKFLKESFTELRDAAGVKPPVKSPRQRKTRVGTTSVKSAGKECSKAPEPVAKVRISIPLNVPAPSAEKAESAPPAEEETVLAPVA